MFIDRLADVRCGAVTAFFGGRAAVRTAVGVRGRRVQNAERIGIDLVPRATVAGQRHRRVARTVIGPVARDDTAARLAGRLPCELHRVLVRVGAAEREEHAAAGESGFLEQQLGELRARLRAPCAGDEAKLLRLLADRRDDLGMLMAEIAALGEAAHVQDGTTVGGVNPRALAADDGRGGPVGLPAPAVQNGIVFGKHAGL